MKITVSQFFTFLIFISLFSCGEDDSSPSNPGVATSSNKTLLELIENDPNLSEFEKYLIEDSSLLNLLNDENDFITVFAFNDNAYSMIESQLYNGGNFESLNSEEIQDILKYHISTTSVLTFSDLEQGFKIFTESRNQFGNRNQLEVNPDRSIKGGTNNQRANIISKDIRAINGILHIIDEVLLPAAYSVNPDTSSNFGEVVFLNSSLTVADGDSIGILDEFSIYFSAERGEFPMSRWELLLDDEVYNSRAGTVIDQDRFEILERGIIAPGFSGTYVFTIAVYDIFDNRFSTDFTLIVNDPFNVIEITGLYMGAQANSNYGSFFNLENQLTFTLSQANTDGGESIDFFFYRSNSSDYFIHSPSNPTVNGYFGGAIAAWGTRNDTKFANSPNNYDDLTSFDILGIEGSNYQRRNFLPGELIAFELENGTKGVIKITEITQFFSGYVKFDIKYIN